MQIKDVNVINADGSTSRDSWPQWAIMMQQRIDQSQPVIMLPSCPTPIYNMPVETEAPPGGIRVDRRGQAQDGKMQVVVVMMMMIGGSKG